MDDLIEEFIAETSEGIEELDNDIVTLEQNPNDKELLSKIFRLMHTIKGTCGFLGLPRLESVAHSAENVLGKYRDGEIEVKPESVTLIFESLDRIREIVAAIAETGSEPEGSDQDLIAKLDAVYEGTAAPADSQAVSDLQDVKDDGGSGVEAEDLHPDETVEEQSSEAAVPATVDQPAATKDVASPAATLRVNVGVLEQLMTTVSELVLVRNQLLQTLRQQGETEFAGPLQQLNLVVSEIQESVMQTRMQPIGNAWNKLPRIIRDLSMELGKKIKLDMRGQDTELDRQVLDLIRDPLTHMVRNSADHGIEMPEDRVAAGKSEEGTVILNAFHEGGHIIIEISDDGKGLAVDKIKQKALDNGIVTESELAEMTDQQIQQFIFHAGFSTAAQVTAVSGRGVGMDVVRTNIEKINGTIELKSVEGKGSTFTIKIPLTLAIVSAMIVGVAHQRYAVPQLCVRELVRIDGEKDENRIEMIKDSPVLRLRDKLLPLVSLENLLELRPNVPANDETLDSDNDQVSRKSCEEKYVVVTQVGGYHFGIVVDQVYDMEEIVVKPVSSILQNIPLFSGNTLLGDGSVIMIIDPNGVANTLSDISLAGTSDEADADSLHLSTKGKKVSLLVFKTQDDVLRAVPLSLVARLESLKMEETERAGKTRVVQYREQLMPLLSVSASGELSDSGTHPVLVFSDQDKSMGVVVSEIVDIIEDHLDIQLSGTPNAGMLGSAIIGGKSTEILDVSHCYKKVFGDFINASSQASFESQNEARRILLVDDSPFFLNMMIPLLNLSGYEVTAVGSPQEALDLCDKGIQFDLILSDIEMEGMNGFEFAERVRKETSWKDVPLVALSSHASPDDKSRGLAVGFSDYVQKFDNEALLETISKTSNLSKPEVSNEKVSGA